jgi:TolB protein
MNRYLPLILVALTAAVAVASSQATAPGKNGLIVFEHPPPGRLWVVAPDGSGLRKLTTTKGPQFDDDYPDWSRDGSKIAFQRCQQRCAVWTINANGTGLKPFSCGDCGMPAWSPNGKLIAFSRVWGGVQNDQIKYAEIFVMTASGTGKRQLTHVTTSKPFSTDVGHPAWSPNGKQLVFEVHNSKSGDPANARALFTINADGSGLHQLTPWELNGGGKLDWSPDGKLILFGSYDAPGHEEHGNLYTIHPDGTGLKRLTNYPAPKTVGAGSFSPDGKWIVFYRFSSTPYPDIFVMRSNGSGTRQVTHGQTGLGFAPDWGPAH